MKKIRFKTLFLVSMVMTFLLILPVMASAAVPWSTETYRAYAYAQTVWKCMSGSQWVPCSNHGEGEQETFGPPLPISAILYDEYNRSQSNITGTQMTIVDYNELDASSYSITSASSAEFSGSFTAVDPIFQFTYAYDYRAKKGDDKFYITVYDATDSVSLYDYTLILPDAYGATPASYSDLLNINVQSGHVINVNFGIMGKSYAEYYPFSPYDSTTINLTYSMAVAPEPISSILFVTGGTLLAGRRFIRRKA